MMVDDRLLRDAGCSLAMTASGLARGIHPLVRAAVAEVVRVAECHWAADSVADGAIHEDPRYFAALAKVDGGEFDGIGLGTDFILAAHAELRAGHPDAGQWRRDEIDGAPSPPLIRQFLSDFDAITSDDVGLSQSAVATALANHGLMWLQPFEAATEQVARLHSRACFRRHGLCPDLWPLSRGLRPANEYRAALAVGGGELDRFAAYFIWACSEQASFMSELLDGLLGRLDSFIAVEAGKGRMDGRVIRLIEVAWLRGQVAKSDLPGLLGCTDRHARRLIEPLLASGLVATEGRAAPYHLRFPLQHAGVLFPGLFGGV